MNEFNRFALDYMDDWWKYDRHFIAGLSPGQNRETRLRWLQKAATNYKVNRNFHDIPGEERLDSALKALDTITNSVTNATVVSTVGGLVEKLRLAYGKTLISAASKFLWFRFQSPVVIFDGRAFTSLKKTCGGRLSANDYEAYWKEWLLEFAKHEKSIQSACDELAGLKGLSLARDLTDMSFKKLANERWFHERVFDKYLWTHGES